MFGLTWDQNMLKFIVAKSKSCAKKRLDLLGHGFVRPPGGGEKKSDGCLGELGSPQGVVLHRGSIRVDLHFALLVCC